MTPILLTPRKLLTAATMMLAASIAFGVVRVVTVPADAFADTGRKPLPVILLTGYEPFGKKKPANPSWEGIKNLDDREWNGHRLVAKQVKVVWGEPRTQLTQWVDEYKPAAILAFGQGSTQGFGLEVRARNVRGQFRDNHNRTPQEPAIVAGGPDQFLGTLRFEPYARSLLAKGYPVRVSSDAGRYLCEEMLYTLEHLKSQDRLDGTVLFCHVPPLGKMADGTWVTSEYVQRFVEDLLATWYAVDATPPVDSRTADVKAMVERYFRVWSEQDMKAYDDCFLPDASIQFIDAAGDMSSTPRDQFVDSQRRYHRTSPLRTIEVPTAIDIKFEGPLARAVVAWKLTAGARTETGYDHFTLMNQNGHWRIVNLVFYATPAGWDRRAAKP